MRFTRKDMLGDIYEGEEHLLEEVPRLGWARFFRGRKNALGRVRCLKDSYEIYHVVDGIFTIRVAGHMCRARPGEVLIVRPGEHFSGLGTLCVVEPCEIRWLEFRVRELKAPLTVARENKCTILNEFAAIKSRSFPISQETASALEHLLDEHQRSLGHVVLAARSSLYSFVVGLVRDYRRATVRRSRQPRRPSWVQALLDWTAKQPAGQISPREMADVAGMSVPHFYKVFRREFGITPADYLMRRRVCKAKRHLAEGDLSVTDIANRLGFSSSQHFATVFKRYTAMTPSTYRSQGR